MVTNYVTSLIRVWTPIGIGALLTWAAATLGVVVTPSSETALVALCVAVLSASYYALARLLEHAWPPLGVLLGVAAKVNYDDPGSTSVGTVHMTAVTHVGTMDDLADKVADRVKAANVSRPMPFPPAARLEAVPEYDVTPAAMLAKKPARKVAAKRAPRKAAPKKTV